MGIQASVLHHVHATKESASTTILLYPNCHAIAKP
ncbi:uncharacterized protein G2W53_039727 [Senna tora]|uniref:Uncharacterized protein n=1 Tax=Senna tora TaxID=362788 RepID=A0A834SQG2_9FABA|nr:uncharacterized protein G2W53_039727 [Senna tora]